MMADQAHSSDGVLAGNRRWFAASIALLFAALAVATALTKRPFFDEAFFAAPGLDLVTRGSMGNPIVEPLGFSSSPGIPALRVNTSAYFAPPLSFLTQAAWYKIVGFGVLRMRLLSTLWGLAALAAWFVIALRITGSETAALGAAFLIGCDHFFLDSGTSGRPDMMSAALGAMAIAAYLALRESGLGRAVLVSQLFLAAAFFTHPIGGIAIFAITLFAIAYDRKRLQLRHCLIAALPYLALGGIWAWYISLDVPAFRAQMAGNTGGRAAGLAAPLESLAREVAWRFLDRSYYPSYAAGFRKITVLIPVIFAVSVVWLLLDRPAAKTSAGRLLAALALCYFFVFGIFDTSKANFYLVHTTPLLACCAAVWAHAQWRRGSARHWLSLGAVGLLVFLQLAWNIHGITRDSYHKVYEPAVRYLSAHAAPQDLIFATGEFGFGLGFYRNVRDDSTLGYFTGKRASYIVFEESGYGQSFKGFADRNPGLERYVRNSLAADYEKVYANEEYEIFHRYR
jgi:dolichyl-phosphate-mannose-protein mannosyltransferase